MHAGGLGLAVAGLTRRGPNAGHAKSNGSLPAGAHPGGFSARQHCGARSASPEATAPSASPVLLL
jgi:hypothetical protein